MNQLEQVYICDCTLIDRVSQGELSFREKIEMCRIIDRLGVASINMNEIRQPRIDALLIKSVALAVTQAAVAVPVSLTRPESVAETWEALSSAKKSRLQVVAPVSSVQMEYLQHLKPAALLENLKRTLRACAEKTDQVEFVAGDATRSDPAFLRQVISVALESGARYITLCDTAGIMTSEETADFIGGLMQDLPGLKSAVVGFFSSNALSLADACAYAAVRAGVREIKAAACGSSSVSLANIVRLLSVKGKENGVCCAVGTEQLSRVTAQAAMICRSAGSKNVSFRDDLTAGEQELVLSTHDSFDTLIHATESLGYDLGAEDQQKVWKSFKQTAERKGQVTLRELDAIIAAEAMQVPPAYHNISYVITTGNETGAMSRMRLMYHDEIMEGVATGDGAIAAAFNSIEKATGRHFELDDFQIQAVSQGREAMGETVVRLRWEGKLYSGRGISTDIVGAGIMAYMNAVNKIVYEEEEA